MSADLSAIQAHWNQRASLGETAGTQDLILKELERRAIRDGLRTHSLVNGCVADPYVLEIGCGLGETARAIAGDFFGGLILAVDSSPEMIRGAERGPQMTNVRFQVGDVADLPVAEESCDVVYAQRCLINLPTWDHQKAALEAIASRLACNGLFLMCEHSQDGLDEINAMRDHLGLSVIQPPWHNRYFRDAELATVTSLKLIQCVPFSATYYFLSRIVNAYVADQQGIEPAYDAPINQLALTLPAGTDPKYAQGRLWVWEKA